MTKILFNNINYQINNKLNNILIKMNNKYVTIFSSNYKDCKLIIDVIGVYNSETEAIKHMIKYLCENKDLVYTFGFEIFIESKNEGFWNDIKDDYSGMNIGFDLNQLDNIDNKNDFIDFLTNNVNTLNKLKILCEMFGDSYFEDDYGWRIIIKNC